MARTKHVRRVGLQFGDGHLIQMLRIKGHIQGDAVEGGKYQEDKMILLKREDLSPTEMNALDSLVASVLMPAINRKLQGG